MNIHDYKLMDCLDKGIKDVIWISYDETLVNKLINKRYYRKKVNNMWDKPSYFFFRYRNDKELFMNKCYEYIKNKDIQMVDEAIGNLLGFPPKATKLFRDKANNGAENILVNFCGMYFASYPESIKEDIDWLFKNKPLINGEIIRIKHESFTIGEYNWLESINTTVNILSKTK